MTKPRSARPTHAPFRCLVWERWASSHKTAHPLDLLCAKPNASRVLAIRTQTRAILWLQNQRVDTLALFVPRLSLECKFETICILRALFIFISSKIFLTRSLMQFPQYLVRYFQHLLPTAIAEDPCVVVPALPTATAFAP